MTPTGQISSILTPERLRTSATTKSPDLICTTHLAEVISSSRHVFAAVHSKTADRATIPPFFVFTKGSKSRDARFRGLPVPGVENDPDHLVAIWRTKNGERFQNYRAQFTILDVGVVSRQWIDARRSGKPLDSTAPAAWRIWVQSSAYRPLIAEPTIWEM
jgi:hypothetical protein